jgi:GNAT superfamily N-acetyltransferase
LKQTNRSLGSCIDPEDFDLKFVTGFPLCDPDPSEYVTQIRGKILMTDQSSHPEDTGAGSYVRVGRIALSIYQLERAFEDRQEPDTVFDVIDELALQLYREIYDGYAFTAKAETALNDSGVISPSLLVIDSVEVLPSYRGRGLALAAVLKAMQVFGPAGGLAALWASPLNYGADKADVLRWRERMKMGEFEQDPLKARDKLAAYWRRLGFRRVGFAPAELFVRSLGTLLPRMSEVLDEFRRNK